MLLIDANVLIYAFREDDPHHQAHSRWLQATLASQASIGISDSVLSAVIRVVTHPRLPRRPTPLDDALRYANWLRGHPRSLLIAPGPRHWEIFLHLCRAVNARGNLVTDAFLAALAIENSAELVSTDRDFARFPGLRWRPPLPS
jgi:hypothetical protein